MKLSKLLLLSMTGIALAACSSGGTDDTLVGNGNNAAAGGGGGAVGGGGGTGGGTGTVRIGNGSGAGFTDGAIALSQTMLPAGGSVSLTVNFVDDTGTLVSDSIDVTFASTCAAGGLASIVEPTVTTTTGSATATYSATGCSGDDEITATANSAGAILRATGTVNVQPAAVGSINFISADPTNIGLQGTGGAGRQETATVRFRVTDSTGGPRPGADVTFELNSSVGGVALQPATAVSDAQGFVQTVVSAGSVSTSVRVRAEVVGTTPLIATQSDQLTITTGIPDQNSVSLSTECVNIEGWDFDGETTETTIRLSDRFNNPVPDGTAATFSAEGAQIGGSCVTATTQATGGGACSVSFVSQSPRPADGRVTVLASTIGEESFIDANSNGQFDAGESVDEIDEPFQDDNESGGYDAGEPFRDFNSDGIRDSAVPLTTNYNRDYAGFNGLLCTAGAPACAGLDTLFVSDSLVIVLSASTAFITDNVGGTLTGGGGNVTFTIGDFKGNGTLSQPLAGGTRVSFSSTSGSVTPSALTIPCTNFNGPLQYTVGVQNVTQAGTLTVTTETPNGIQTRYTIGLQP
ncbi:MAG: hypothetical protein AAGC71_01050 [Pseudomonadota bacterium]